MLKGLLIFLNANGVMLLMFEYFDILFLLKGSDGCCFMSILLTLLLPAAPKYGAAQRNPLFFWPLEMASWYIFSSLYANFCFYSSVIIEPCCISIIWPCSDGMCTSLSKSPLSKSSLRVFCAGSVDSTLFFGEQLIIFYIYN